jgi:phage terminase Nu1 subunit (DNA packaging protein)
METMRLGSLAAKIGESERQIQRIVDQGLAPRPEKKGQYDVWAIVRGLLRYYRDRASKISEERTRDAARKAKADADNAELDNEEKRGGIKRRFDEYGKYIGVTWRKEIMGMDFIPLDSRKRQLKILSELDIPIPAAKR